MRLNFRLATFIFMFRADMKQLSGIRKYWVLKLLKNLNFNGYKLD